FPVDGQVHMPTGGYYNLFQGATCGGQPYGVIYYGATEGWVEGCIDYYYEHDPNGPGGPTEALGFPVGGQVHIATGGYYNLFQGTSCGVQPYGVIYYGATEGWLEGCIARKYIVDMGGPNGADKLGFPIGGQVPITGGYVNYFSGHGCSSGKGPHNSSSAIY